MDFQLSISSPDTLCVAGRIDLTNVIIACQQGKELINSMADVKVDLSGMQQGDSSSLAMLIDWLRCAKSQNKNIIFKHMPQFMLDLGRVCGLDSILPIDKVLQFQN